MLNARQDMFVCALARLLGCTLEMDRDGCTKLDLGPDATRPDVLKAMDGHVVAKASATERFHR